MRASCSAGGSSSAKRSPRRVSPASSSSSTGSFWSRGEQEVEEEPGVAANTRDVVALVLLEVERARVGEGPQPALADQQLVDAADPAAVRRVDGDAERRGLAVHRPAGRDDEV